MDLVQLTYFIDEDSEAQKVNASCLKQHRGWADLLILPLVLISVPALSPASWAGRVSCILLTPQPFPKSPSLKGEGKADMGKSKGSCDSLFQMTKTRIPILKLIHGRPQADPKWGKT